LPQEPCDRPATEQLELLESGYFTAAELLACGLERLGRMRPGTITAGLLDAVRRAAEHRAGEGAPLAGLLVAVAADLPGRAGIAVNAEAAGAIVVDTEPGEGARLLVAGAVAAAFVRTFSDTGDMAALRTTSGPVLLARTVPDLAVFLSLVEGDRVRSAAGAWEIGAHSDSIADIELRAAVADVAALLSLHGKNILDLDAGRPTLRDKLRRRPAPAVTRPDIVVSAAGQRPQWTNPTVTMPVGTGSRGRTLAVRFTARPGLDRDMLDLARLVDADLP
jgi:hypothetical protein